ncbi:MAG: aminotransferase class I/II-fold pyridoxal phosphate-dependent enzyme, partial [Candidatus Hodarchaeota archaeon]
FYSCRYALAAALKNIITSPKDNILLPSYNCSTEIDPVLSVGAKPIFYRVTRELNIDIDDLVLKINKNTKAILVTHYFGFSLPLNEIKNICEERNILLIEDCAHSFLSQADGHYLGSTGDFAVFSLWKILPVPDGGLLVVNNPRIQFSLKKVAPPLFPFLYVAGKMLSHISYDHLDLRTISMKLFLRSVFLALKAARLFMRGLKKLTGKGRLHLLIPDSYEFLSEAIKLEISKFSKRIIESSDLKSIKNVRRNNYKYLHQNIKRIHGIKLVFDELPDGTNPLFFPIIVKNRKNLYQRMKQKGVVTFPFWEVFHKEVPWDKFPDAVFLKNHLLGLPVHQDLTQRNLDYLLETLDQIFAQTKAL